MRHYFGYDLDGNLRSYESYGPAGWPTSHCLEDGECDEAAVSSLREMRNKQNPEIVNWVLYDCPCDPAQGDLLRNCKCAGPKIAESYVDTNARVIRPKPIRTVVVDGQVVADREVVTAAPGTSVDFKVVCHGLPDGEKVKCVQKGSVDITVEDEWEMTIANGETETKTLVAPAQGTKGYIMIGGTRVRPLTFGLRGFVAP